MSREEKTVCFAVPLSAADLISFFSSMRWQVSGALKAFEQADEEEKAKFVADGNKFLRDRLQSAYPGAEIVIAPASEWSMDRYPGYRITDQITHVVSSVVHAAAADDTWAKRVPAIYLEKIRQATEGREES